MDLLRFLMMLPVRLAAWVRSMFRALGAFARPQTGSVSWTRPPWMSDLAAAMRRRRIRPAQPGDGAAATMPDAEANPSRMAALVDAIYRRPLHFAGGAAAILVVFAAGLVAWHWYANRQEAPEQARITIDAQAPAVTDYEQSDGTPAVVIHPLDVKFSGSAAPIELVGKAVTHGIAMEPALKGTWRWVDDRTLRFTPDADWPVGAHETVRFTLATVFAPHVLMADDHVDFDVPGFAVTAGDGEFYQDPQNPAAKKTIMPVVFNYPVDPAQFEKRVSLALKGHGGKPAVPLKFTVTYDAAKIKAWVHSQPLDLPHDDDMMQLVLDKGVRSSRGGDGTDTPLDMSVRVPGLYSLTVGDVGATLVNNDKFEPEQVLVLSTSDAVRGTDLAGAVRAWVLPARRAGKKQAADAPPYGWDMTEVSEDVLRHSQTLKLELVPTEKEYAQAQSFKYHADPGQRLYIRFPAGLRSFGGYILAKPNSQIVAVPDYPNLLRFMADGSLLSLSGDKRVSVVSRNVPGMKLEIGRVLPDQLQHLVSFNEGTFTHPELNGSFDEDHIVERFEQTRVFPKGDPGQAHYEGVDLSDYLKEGKHGVFLLHLTSYKPPAKKDDAASGDDAASDDASGDDASGDDSASGDNQAEVSDTRLIVVTDLGLIAKRAVDGSREVFVQSIHTGQPVGGAVVSVLALNGETLYSETSSADGEVHFPTLKGLEHEKKPVMYLVKKGDDLSFLPIDGRDRRLDYSRFDIGGDANATSEGALSAYLFSDRGIYRPGDKIHIGVIVRTASWAHSAAGIPLQAEIVDPRSASVKKQALTVDASGFAELDYTPAETAPTGTWTVNLYIAGKGSDETAIGSTTVSVKEFLPDSMKVDAGLSAHVADGWVKPAQLKGIVDVHNLFGTPAANRRVEASLTLNPTFPAFRDWADYQFFDLRHAKDGYTTQLQDGHTNDAGHAEFDLDLKKYADATYRLDFLAKAYEAAGGRSVAASAETLVSSNDWLVGYKSVDDLAYLTRGSRHSVHLVAIDPQTKSIELKGLQAQLIERRYVSVLTKQDSGVYKYESKLKEVPVATAPLTIPAGGLDYALVTDKPGDYAVLIRSGDVSVNRIDYTVAGEANVSRSLERNAELQIKLSKKDYVPGEAVEISLRAPYVGSGLITIERDKVYAHAWFTARTTNSVQHITVPAGFEGNGYINVQYIRDPSSDEIFMSPLSYGVAPFSVNVDARRNKLSVETPDLVKPGQTITFKLHSGHPTKAVLFAVDEGILQVGHYKLGDPLTFFFSKRMLEVQTSQILDLILPDFKKLMAAAAPGGDGGDAIGRQLNPFKRKRDKPVAYWSGIVDVNGEKDLQYTVPDYFHGKLHVMAVSVSPDLIGIAEGATTVRGDFTLSPNAPTTLAPGDEAEVSVGVSNNLQGAGTAAMPVAVALKTGPQLQVIGAAVQKLSLAPMHEGVAIFRVRATDNLGSGDLAFTASYGAKTAGQNIDISVRPASAYRTQVDIAPVRPGGSVMFSDLRRMYGAYGARSASISTGPLILSGGLSNWLVNYDNYCSEQIVSASLPRLLMSKWPGVPVLARAGDSGKSASDVLATQIDVLRARQNEQGGFGVWTATPDSEPFVSAYVMQFLLEARDRGVPVSKEMIESGNTYLHSLADDDAPDTLDAIRQRAYAVYLLTRQGIVTTNELAAVQKRLQDLFGNDGKNDLAAAWLAASYKLMKQDKEASLLIAGPQRLLERGTDNGSYDYDYYEDPLTRDATVLYLLTRYFPERAKQLSPNAMNNIVRPLEKNEFNTVSAAMTMLALDVYANANAAAVEKLAIAQIDAKGTSKPISTITNKWLQTGDWSGAAARLRFSDASAVPAWLVVGQAGYDRDSNPRPIRNGLEIARDYTDTHDKPLGAITLGEEIDVHLRIRATGDKGVGNIAIVDLLPGGFDPVIEAPPAPDGGDAAPAPTIRQPGSTWDTVYADVREDRVVIYGTATPDVKEFVYRIKASSAGKFLVPQAYGESMYDRRVQARAAGGAMLTVARVP